MTQRYSTDIVIIGGGIAGLWLLNRIHSLGLAAILLESSSLGNGQTIASQGIIHGGLKFALDGKLNSAANLIAGMPAHWRNCLAGKGDIDLGATKLLSPHYYMWSEGNFRSRLKSFLGSKSLRGRIDAVSPQHFPEVFDADIASGSLYQLTDFVIDTPSLLENLRKPYADKIFQIEGDTIGFEFDPQGNIKTTVLQVKGEAVHINANRTVFSAGAGNEALMQKAGIVSPEMQRRPLHMVTVKSKDLPDAYVHCIGTNFSMTPKLTITTHRAADGDQVWYLGGELAESGVERDTEQQIDAARKLLKSLFPQLDLSASVFDCIEISRAEARVNNSFRPDGSTLGGSKNVLVCWPTKLTLTPILGEKVIALLQDEMNTGRLAPTNCAIDGLELLFNYATVAIPHWDRIPS